MVISFHCLVYSFAMLRSCIFDFLELLGDMSGEVLKIKCLDGSKLKGAFTNGSNIDAHGDG